MKDCAELITALANLLWPVFAFTFIFVFKRPITDLLNRIKSGKLFGQEFELTESLNQLEESAKAGEQEVASLPKLDDSSANQVSLTDDQITFILQEAARSPKTALILLASQLEQEARQLLASVGHSKGQRYIPFAQAMDILSKQFGGFPGHIPNSLKLFWETRNQIVHGVDADKGEILRAIDSGITILKTLKAFPRETNFVYHPNITVYQDMLCRTPWPDVHGVLLETETAGGAQRFFRIFPTTKTHFIKGKRVAWEWSTDKFWSDAWYKDPDTGEVKLAWNSALEFVGRHLEDV